MQQLLSSQVLTCVEATVRESPRLVRLSCSILRPKSRLHFLHTQLPLLVFAAIFPIGKVLCSHAKGVQGPTGTRTNLVDSQFVRVVLAILIMRLRLLVLLLLLLLRGTRHPPISHHSPHAPPLTLCAVPNTHAQWPGPRPFQNRHRSWPRSSR